MNKILPVIAAFLAFSALASAQAAQSPSARTCRIAGGQPWSIELEDLSDQVELCAFGGGMIDSFSFYKATVLDERTLAVEAFLKGESCAYAPAWGMDSDGIRIGICTFRDGSFVEQRTLRRGPTDPANAALIDALLRHS